VLADGRGECLALDGGNLKLESRGLARAITTSKGAGAPGASSMDLVEVGQLTEGLAITERHIDDAVVGQGGHGREGGRLLAATGGACRDEDAGQLSPEATSSPLLASLVPEGLLQEHCR
jgi:hypothetical protein